MISASPSQTAVSGLSLPSTASITATSSTALSGSNSSNSHHHPLPSSSDRLHPASTNSALNGGSTGSGAGAGSSAYPLSGSNSHGNSSALATGNGTGVPFIYSQRGHPNFNPTKPVAQLVQVPIPRPMVREIQSSSRRRTGEVF